VDSKLEAQLACLRGDARLIERARAALELTLEERLVVMARSCAEATAYPRLDERPMDLEQLFAAQGSAMDLAYARPGSRPSPPTPGTAGAPRSTRWWRVGRQR
jgi:hypothetical protein